jgi:hypothetical protein
VTRPERRPPGCRRSPAIARGTGLHVRTKIPAAGTEQTGRTVANRANRGRKFPEVPTWLPTCPPRCPPGWRRFPAIARRTGLHVRTKIPAAGTVEPWRTGRTGRTAAGSFPRCPPRCPPGCRWSPAIARRTGLHVRTKIPAAGTVEPWRTGRTVANRSNRGEPVEPRPELSRGAHRAARRAHLVAHLVADGSQRSHGEPACTSGPRSPRPERIEPWRTGRTVANRSNRGKPVEPWRTG